jgi:hypothetical protein
MEEKHSSAANGLDNIEFRALTDVRLFFKSEIIQILHR